MKGLVTILMVAGMLAACGGGGGTPAAPPSVDVTGKWVGTLSSNYGNYSATEIMTQSGAGASGTYSSSNGGGSISGTVSANNLSFTISPTGCTGSLTGNGLVTNNTTTGKQQIAVTYAGLYVCSGTTYNESGTGTLIKQ